MIAAQRCQQGGEVFVIAFQGFTDPAWVAAHPHAWVRLGQLGKAFSLLKKQKIEQIAFAGHIRRPGWSEIRPDWTGLKLLWRLKRKKMGDDSLLRKLASVFQEQGIELVGADTLLPDCLMPSGQLSDAKITAEDWNDIRYAQKILTEWASLDQGQSIVVQNGLILGVEAIEGTDELIKRCGQYKRKGRGPILVKIKKPQQDARLDMPTIGVETIRNAIDAGFAGIAVQENQSLFLQPTDAIELANQYNLFITGFNGSHE